jgi:cytochrome c
MNSFELNKVLGAILGTCLITLALNIGAGALFKPEKPAKPGYIIAVKTETARPKTAATKEEPLPVRLAKASVDKGKSIAKQCQACHTFEKGGPNRVGPNLYGVVDRPRASHPGFNYSSAMKSKGGKWTFDELDKFITDPRGDISGTAMTFAGIKNDQQRADVIDFLHTLSDNPEPLPKPEAQNAPAAQGGGAAENKPAEAPKPGAAPAGQPGANPPK